MVLYSADIRIELFLCTSMSVCAISLKFISKLNDCSIYQMLKLVLLHAVFVQSCYCKICKSYDTAK